MFAGGSQKDLRLKIIKCIFTLSWKNFRCQAFKGRANLKDPVFTITHWCIRIINLVSKNLLTQSLFCYFARGVFATLLRPCCRTVWLYLIFNKGEINHQHDLVVSIPWCYWWRLVYFAVTFSPYGIAKKWNFSLRISLVNVTKSIENFGFGTIYWRNPWWKTSFFVQA